MNEYEVSFKYDFFEVEEREDSPDANADILYMCTDGFDKTFDSEKKVKEFEEWYNEGAEYPITFIDIDFDSDEEKGFIFITTENEIPNEEEFAKEIVNYLFEGTCPSVKVNFYGSDYFPDWNDIRQEPTETKQKFEYIEEFIIDNYTDVVINKIK